VSDSTAVSDGSRSDMKLAIPELAGTGVPLPSWPIVFDFREKLCQERNRHRPGRDFGPHVIRQQSQQLLRSLRSLEHEGFRRVRLLRSPQEVDSAEIAREPLWKNLKHERGPFEIIGDVHG
jgi:protein phosphatase